jgi:hypothetical protein
VITETVANIILDARRHADAETPSPTTDFTPDAELLRYFNTAYRKFVDMVISSGDAAVGLLLKSAVLTSPYSLPSDFYRLASVDLLSGSDWREVKPFAFRQRNVYKDTSIPRYRLEGQALVLVPSTAVPTLQVWYVPDGGTATSGASINTLNGWDDFLAYDVASQIALKEDRDLSALHAFRDEAAARIMQACEDLSAVDTATIADVQRFDEDYFDFWR